MLAPWVPTSALQMPWSFRFEMAHAMLWFASLSCTTLAAGADESACWRNYFEWFDRASLPFKSDGTRSAAVL